MAGLTYGDINSWRQSLIKLLQERDHLARENAILKQQIQQLQGVGTQLSPELAKSWLPRFEQCPAWAQLAMGDGSWDYELNAPSGGGLKDLLADLQAVPTTDLDRAMWKQRTPAPTRKPDLSATSWLLNQQHPGLGDSLNALIKGMRGRLPLVIKVAFLLYGQEAVAKLANEPEVVLEHIRQECIRAGKPASDRSSRRFGDYLNHLLQNLRPSAEAREVLGVGADATADEIKQAYRQLAKQHHPDAGGDPEQFHRIQQAYELLQQQAAVTA